MTTETASKAMFERTNIFTEDFLIYEQASYSTNTTRVGDMEEHQGYLLPVTSTPLNRSFLTIWLHKVTELSSVQYRSRG